MVLGGSVASITLFNSSVTVNPFEFELRATNQIREKEKTISRRSSLVSRADFRPIKSTAGIGFRPGATLCP